MATANNMTGVALGSIMAIIMTHHIKNIRMMYWRFQEPGGIMSIPIRVCRVISSPLIPIPAPARI
jgi:hypothetical protein